MAILSLQNFTTLTNNFAAVVQGACRSLIDFSTGSILLSVAEASSAVGLWMQWLILQVLALTRAATSNGTDLDSWVADFTLVRLPATVAQGTVTFSRFTPTSQALILPGAQVKTADGTQTFNVIADTAKTAWNATLGGYVIAAGISSSDATVQAVNSGIQGNVQAGAITLLSSAISFVDTVSNALNFANGIDAESDAALRVRFGLFIQGLARGTIAAIGYAISSVQQGLSWTIQENITVGGGFMPGNFVVTIDDGSGTPSATLQTAVSAAIALYRPAGSTWTVRAPTVTLATISFSYTTTPTANKTAAMTIAVQAAVVAYVNALPDGAPLIYSRIAGIAYGIDPTITAVENVLLNSGTADLTPDQSHAVKATIGSVSVT